MDTCFPDETIKDIPKSRILLLERIHRADQPGNMSEFPSWISKTNLPYECMTILSLAQALCLL